MLLVCLVFGGKVTSFHGNKQTGTGRMFAGAGKYYKYNLNELSVSQ